MGKINAEWHRANPMPKNPTMDQRLAWHVAHAAACACREELPGSIVAEMKRRGMPVPNKAGHQ
jgi:hypothetical protein